METSEIAKSEAATIVAAIATISPSCGHKQREMTVNPMTKNSSVATDTNTNAGGTSSLTVPDKRKYALHLQTESSLSKSSSRLYKHVDKHVDVPTPTPTSDVDLDVDLDASMSNSNSIGENDCTTLPTTEQKKPLHLQIIEDGTCSSSDYDNRPSSPGSGDDPNPASTHSSKSVPVSSDRNELILGDDNADNAADKDDDNNNDRIIIESSSKCIPMNHLNDTDTGQPSPSASIPRADFVPLGNVFKRTDVLKLSLGLPNPSTSAVPVAVVAAEAQTQNRDKALDHTTVNSSSNIDISSNGTSNSKSNDNLSSKTKNHTDETLTLPNIPSDPKSANTNTIDIDPRDDGSTSSTPDLASMIQCSEEMKGQTTTHEHEHEPDNSKAFRAVSTSSSENGNSPTLAIANTETETDSDPSDNTSTKDKDPMTIDVASALDQVLAELEDSGINRAKNKKDRPCILQQSLVGDSGSSGTSTPNEDFLDGSNNSNGKKLEDRDSNKANSLRVESSMLLPEDSLNVIAQMTIASGGKKEKKNVVTFGEDSLISEDIPVEKEPDNDSQNTNSNTNTSTNTPKKTIANSTKKLGSLTPSPFLKGMNPEIINKIIPSPVNNGFNKITPLQNSTPKAMKKIPLISGTAAAQLKVIADKTTNSSPSSKQSSPTDTSTCGYSPLSKPLSGPPQIQPMSSTLMPQLDNTSSGNEKEKDESKNDEEQIIGGNWEKGMSMLADIISNAAPMRTKSGTNAFGSTNGALNTLKTPNNTMVPVGQSLRLYASIAAQAGISSYKSESAIPETIQPVHQPQEAIIKPATNICTIPEVSQPSQPINEPKHHVREIGKIRRFNASINAFGEWEDLPFQTYGDTEPRRWCELNIDESIEIPLRRGGRLRVFPNFLGESRRNIMQNTIENCSLYRQYSVFSDNATTAEPKLQVLLSSQAKEEHGISNDGVGYRYRGVSMKAKPISMEPQVEALSRDLAELYRLPNQEWNIGANLVYYRDGNDHTTWHSDDTQGEALILCIVVESHAFARPILVKPKTNGGFQDGDEEIIIFVGQGDAYEMDGQMQMNYEHCLPVKQDNINAKRSAIIFRHGNTTPVSLDTGIPLVSEATESSQIIADQRATAPKLSTQFGHLDGAIREGKKLYTKDMLVEIGAHRHEKKYISGSIREGCESILVDNQDRLLREDDGLYWLQISCTKSNGGGALCQSFHKKCCIRVFRSSNLDNKYAPALYEGEENQVLYRYDGVYTVRAMWDTQGCETESPPTSDEIYTYFLMRQPKRPVDGTAEEGMYYNKISLQELWNEIQKRKGVRKPKDFAVPEPIMEVGRIGDKSNARRRPASSRRVLNNSCNDAPSKKKNANIIPLSKYSAFAGNSSVFRHRSIYSSDSDTDDESEDDDTERMDVDEVDEPIIETNSNTRPTRRSAAVARNYLKEVMHNRYGDMEKNSPTHSSTDRRTKRSLWSTASRDTFDEDEIQAKAGKRQCQEDSSTDDDDDDENYESTTQDIEKSIKAESHECDVAMADETLSNVEEVKSSVEGDNCVLVEEKKKPNANKKPDTKKKPAPRRSYNRKNQKAKIIEKPIVKAETVNEKEDDETAENGNDELPAVEPKRVSIDPQAIKEGHRINVEYRNTLFKATVRKTRMKNDAHEYQIHYDGNKKSNVHWISLSMVHAILDEAIVPISPETKPKRGRKRKQPASKLKESKQVTEEVQPKEEVENQKFANGSEVYAQYKGVLYLSTVRKSRKNRKGDPEYMIHYDGFKKTSDRWLKESLLYEINEETTHRFNEQRGVDEEKAKKELEKKVVVFDPVSTRSLRGKSTAISEEQSNETAHSLDMGDIDSGVEFLPGSCVFVARTDALYLAKMVKRRKKGRGTEYLVQFDGMSSIHNEWICLSIIYELNPKTRKIYEKTSSNRIMPEEEHDSESEPERKVEVKPKVSPKVATRGSKKAKGRPKKPVLSKLYDMQNIEPGVTFLPGSTLFVQWKNGLYLGKMLKKRGKGEHMEYYIHYDGFKSAQDEWVSVSMVFEINPQTKRAFNKQRKKS